MHTTTELTDTIRFLLYVNKKNQLIKITHKKSKSSSYPGVDLDEEHEMLSFDIDQLSLDHNTKHSIESTELVRSEQKPTSHHSGHIFNYSKDDMENEEL